MLKAFLAILACTFAFADVCPAQDTIQDSATGKSFPSTVSFDFQGKNYKLAASGVATRTKLIVKVYSIASYLEPMGRSGGDIFEKILNSKGPKQLSIIYARDVERNKIVNAYHDSFAKAVGNDISSFQEPINKFLSFFGNARANDEQVLRWLPDGTLEVYINKEKKGSIKNENFARAIWSIWFGRNSVVKRENLVSQIK